MINNQVCIKTKIIDIQKAGESTAVSFIDVNKRVWMIFYDRVGWLKYESGYDIGNEVDLLMSREQLEFLEIDYKEYE